MSKAAYNVLFLCTGNSARSILAERIVERLGEGRFRGFSAGSHPTGTVNPLAIALLKEKGILTADLRSKSWDAFAGPSAPQFDFIFTVCDQAAGEACPVWIGHPVTAHWGIPDPAAAQGTEGERRNAFRDAYARLEARIKAFVSLPLEDLDHVALAKRLREIGETRDVVSTP